MQVKLNVLLLECLSAAGRWTEARRHVEALHRSLPLSKQKGPAAAAALEALAGWRATCVAKEASGRVQEDMTRLLAELSTPQAKVSRAASGHCFSVLLVDVCSARAATSLQLCITPSVHLVLLLLCCCAQARAWLALAQASSSPQDQLSGRQSALAALKGLPPGSKVCEWCGAKGVAGSFLNANSWPSGACIHTVTVWLMWMLSGVGMSNLLLTSQLAHASHSLSCAG